MSEAPTCPQCSLADSSEGPTGFECRVCGFEWEPERDDRVPEVLDAHGNPLASGDSVTVIKDLKLDGKAGGVKIGTKVKGIRLVAGDHPVSGKVNGRDILIKAEFVKKAK